MTANRSYPKNSAQSRQAAKRRKEAIDAGRLCENRKCKKPLVPRDGENNTRFLRRRTCGAECTVELRKQTRQKTLETRKVRNEAESMAREDVPGWGRFMEPHPKASGDRSTNY